MVTTQAPERMPDQPCVDCLDHSLATVRTRPAAPRQVAFWLLASVLTIIMLGTTLPTPLYVIYQAQWHFSAILAKPRYVRPRQSRGSPQTRRTPSIPFRVYVHFPFRLFIPA